MPRSQDIDGNETLEIFTSYFIKSDIMKEQQPKGGNAYASKKIHKRNTAK